MSMLTSTWPGILRSWEQRERNQGQVVCGSGGAAFVAVVKPADLGERYDFTLVWCLNRACVGIPIDRAPLFRLIAPTHSD